jgi:hypothetical protein
VKLHVISCAAVRSAWRRRWLGLGRSWYNGTNGVTLPWLQGGVAALVFTAGLDDWILAILWIINEQVDMLFLKWIFVKWIWLGELDTFLFEMDI